MSENTKLKLFMVVVWGAVIFIIYQIASCVHHSYKVSQEEERELMIADSIHRADSIREARKTPEEKKLERERDSIQEAYFKRIIAQQRSGKEKPDVEGDGIARTGNYTYPKCVTVKIHGKRYDLGIGMSEAEVLMKTGDPDDISRATGNVSTVIYYYDRSTVQLFFYDGELNQVIELSNK